MSRFKFVSLFFSCLIFGIYVTSCRKKNISDLEINSLNIPLNKSLEVVKISDISDSVTIIPLQTDTNALLGNIVRIIHLNDTVYVADNRKVLAYDFNGKLIKCFSNYGEGPNQYIGISDIQIDENGLLWVLSRSNKCLYHYDWNGHIINKHQLSFWGAKISFMADKNYMLIYSGNEKDGQNNHQLSIMNLSNGEIVNKFFPIDDKKSIYLHVMTDNNFFSSLDGHNYFQQIFNDTVYELSVDENPVPRFYLNFQGKNIPHSFFEIGYQDVMDFFINLHKYNYAYGVQLLMFNKDKYITSFLYDGKTIMAVYSAKDWKIGASITDDVCLVGYTFDLKDQKFFQQSNEELIIPINAHSLLEHMQLNLNENESILLKKKIGNLTEEDNPVLLKINM